MEKSRLRKLKNATLANMGMAIGSVGVFALTGNSAFVSEAIHDGADTGAHGSRYLSEKLQVNQDTKKYRWFLRSGLLGVSALSAYTAVKMGMSLKNGVITDTSTSENIVNLGSAGVIVAGNSYAYKQVESIEEHSHASEASFDHAKVDMLASWGLAGFIALGAIGVEKAPEIGGTMFASYTAVHLAINAFKPHEH